MATQPQEAPALLEARGLRKRFGGVVALDGVDLTVRPAEIHALVGENGAGKSTLMQIVSGDFRPDAGEVLLRGERVQLDSPADAQRRGIVAVYQELSLIDDLDVAENVLLGREPRIRGPFLNRRRLYQACAHLFGELGIDHIDVRAPVWSLPVADRQLVELGRALSQRAALVIMDEPTSALPTQDEQRLLGLLEDLRRRGTSVLYVTHRLDEVFRVANRVTVLRDGRVAGSLAVAETSPDELVQLMVGRDLARHLFPERHARTPDEHQTPRLEISGLTARGLFTDISLTVASGEIVGLAGLIGSGRTSMLRGVFGALPVTRGSVRIDGELVAPASPREAIEFGLAMVSEDRRRESLALRLDIVRNATAVMLPTTWGLLVNSRGARHLATEGARDVGLRGGVQRLVRHLSGGNQQKVALAKWLAVRPRVLLCDEPTRGIDVGAKAEIYALLRGLADQGVAILFASSELPEVLGLADRIIVMHEGKVSAELSAAEADEHSIIRAASGLPARSTSSSNTRAKIYG